MLKTCPRPSFGVITALVVAATLATARAARAQGPDALVSAAAIQKVLDKQEQDWNKGELDAFLEGYWASPNVVFQSGGDRSVGFDAMRDRYRKRYKAEGRAMGRLAFSEVEIQTLGVDSAFVRGRWGLTLPDGKKPGGLFTLIFRKLPGGWKIVHDHTSAAEPPAAPRAPRPPG
jgi:ketosteroid isomerase-like protein